MIRAKRIYEPKKDDSFDIQKVLGEAMQKSITSSTDQTKMLVSEFERMSSDAGVKKLEEKFYQYIKSLKIDKEEIKKEIYRSIEERVIQINSNQEYLTLEDKDDCINSANEMVNEAVAKFDNLFKPFLKQLESKSDKEHTHSEFTEIMEELEENEKELEEKIDKKADKEHKHKINDIENLADKLDKKADKEHNHDNYATREELNFLAMQRSRGAGGGGHVIQGSGVVSAQRSNLNFVGATVTDDPDNNATLVSIEGGITETSTNTLTNKTLDDYTNFIHADGIHLRIKALENLVRGDVIMFVGFNNGEQAIEVQKRNSELVPAIGVIHTESLSTGDFGMAVSNGLFKRINTSAFAVGTILYPNASGGFTSTASTATGAYNQQLAYVVRQHAVNGEIMINVGPSYAQINDTATNTVTTRSSDKIATEIAGVTLPNFNTSEILFGDGSDTPITSQYFNFNNANNQFTVGGNEVAGSFVLTNERADNTTPQTVNHSFRGFFDTNFFNSLASQISVDLTPDSFGDISEEIYINVKGNETSVDFSPGNTGFGDTYYVSSVVNAGQATVLAGGEYTSGISLDETSVTARGYLYNITNNAKFQPGTVGTMNKNTTGFNIVLNAGGDENGDASTTLNDVLTGFNIFMQGTAKTNGSTSLIGVDFSAGFLGTSKSTDSFYGVRLLNSSIPLPNATNYYAWYSEGGEMFLKSNLATRRNLTLRTFASQSANALTIENSSGSQVMAITGNGAIQPASLADSAAANNTIYYSTTQSKLVYKNSSGTVNVLY